MSKPKKARTVILTASIAMITATGAWYGAGLKTRQELKKDIRTKREATPAEIIAHLEESRSGLIAKRIGLERKITELEERQQKAKDMS